MTRGKHLDLRSGYITDSYGTGVVRKSGGTLRDAANRREINGNNLNPNPTVHSGGEHRSIDAVIPRAARVRYVRGITYVPVA